MGLKNKYNPTNLFRHNQNVGCQCKDNASSGAPNRNDFAFAGGEQWGEANEVLLRSAHLGAAFDHQFRRMLHSIYTADQKALDVILQGLHATYGEQMVYHFYFYSGYCKDIVTGSVLLCPSESG